MYSKNQIECQFCTICRINERLFYGCDKVVNLSSVHSKLLKRTYIVANIQYYTDNTVPFILDEVFKM